MTGPAPEARALDALTRSIGATYRAQATSLLPAAVLLVLPFVLLDAVVPGIDDVDHLAARVAAFAVSFALTIAAYTLGRAVLVAKLVAPRLGDDHSWGAALRSVKRRQRSLFVVGFASLSPQALGLVWAVGESWVGFLIVLTFVFPPVLFATAAAVFVGALVHLWLVIHWSVAIPVVVLEGESAGGALGRSRRIVATDVVVAAVIFVVPSFVASVAADLLHGAGGVVATAAIQAILLPLMAIASVVLYDALHVPATALDPESAPPRRLRPLRADDA